MAHGMVAKGMIHRAQDLGLPVEIDQTNDLFELIKRVKFGFGRVFEIAASRLSQRQ